MGCGVVSMDWGACENVLDGEPTPLRNSKDCPEKFSLAEKKDQPRDKQKAGQRKEYRFSLSMLYVSTDCIRLQL